MSRNLQKKKGNGDIPLGYLGRTVLTMEQCDIWTHCVEKRHFLGNELLRQLHEKCQFLGNQLLEALHNHRHLLLVNGCIDVYSCSNK
jgi:hypothetical protein